LDFRRLGGGGGGAEVDHGVGGNAAFEGTMPTENNS